MQVREFAKPVTANKLNESMAARFGTKLSLTKFTLEQLQDARNRIRTQLSQVETNESFDSVQNETYQKSKMMLDVLNAAISERGGIDEGSKPDFLDIDKDGNKKEPMKKAVADKKKKAPVKEGVALSPKYIKHLQLALRNKGPQLSRSETRELQDILDKLDIANIKTIMNADIPHLSQMAKLYLRNKTPGGMIKYKEAEVQAPTHELDDTARKAMNIAQKIKRKINSGEQMDDRDYNQMAELGAILSRFGTSFGPKSMKDVMAHMVQYTNDRNEEGHGYPEFDVNRFKELMAMASGKSESYAPVSEISSDLAKRYTKAAKMDRDFNDDDIDRLSKSGQSTQDMHRRNAKRTKGINQAKKRM